MIPNYTGAVGAGRGGAAEPAHPDRPQRRLRPLPAAAGLPLHHGGQPVQQAEQTAGPAHPLPARHQVRNSIMWQL